MNRPKLFLTITTCLLAFAAVAATKLKVTPIRGYFTINGSRYTVSSGCSLRPLIAQCRYMTGNGGIYNLYTAHMIHPLYTDTE